MDRELPAKPLGGRAYGSTPHLPGSRVGPGDWHIHGGQARILTERARDGHDRIIVTEKLDGTCVCAARTGSEIVPVIRAGYSARTAPYAMHGLFARWVDERAGRLLSALMDGERIVGEWLVQAHSTRYRIDDVEDLFVGFAVMSGKRRLPHDEARRRMRSAGIRGAHVLSDGPPLPVADALDKLDGGGFHGAIDAVEGAVWVCERKGEFDFIAKHVRQGKVDGMFLPGVAGNDPDMPPLWNFPMAA